MATSVLSAITYAQRLAQTDSNGIGSVLGLELYNDALQTMTRDLVNRQIDAAQVREEYRDIDTGRTPPGQWLWPDDMFMLKTIEINWSDQTEQNYLQATPMDVANIQNKSFSWLRANQPQDNPLFDNRGDYFEIFPTPAASNTNGIRIVHFLTPTEAPDVGTAIDYPQILDYRALSCLIASRYYKTQEDLDMAITYEKEYNDRIAKVISILAPSSQQPITPEPLQMTGWNF